MKNFFLTAALALGLCTLGFAAAYATCHQREETALAADPTAWLRTEFHLTDAQFSAIKKLQMDYGLVCDRRCAEMMAARRRAASGDELHDLEAGCVAVMRRHFTDVAALMPAAEGQRYLAAVLPQIEAVGEATISPDRTHP